MTKQINIEEYLYHFGLDHLELYATHKDEQFIDSNLVEIINGYYVRRMQVDKYFYKIIFYQNENDKNECKNPLFAYYKGLIDQSIPTKDYLVIYSTGFRIMSEDRILFFIDQFHVKKMKRVDIASDILLDINIILSNFKELKQKGSTFNGANGEIETRYIGETQKTKNKRQVLRIYNKNADILSKRKTPLYSDYLLQDNVTRVELEIRSELTRNIHYEDVFNVHILVGLFKNYLSKHTNLFESLPGEKITLYKKKDKKIDPELYQSLYYKDKRRKIFLGHAKLIYNLGFCPVRALILEGYVKDKTKISLGLDKVEGIHEKERIARDLWKENKYYQENLDGILANYYKYGS